MVHLPRLSSREMSRGSSREGQQRISAATAGIVNQILDSQLPPVMKALSPRKITGFNPEEGFVVPRFEHMTDDKFDQYKVSTSQAQQQHITSANECQSSDTLTDKPTFKQYKLQTPEYICFINRHSSELPRSNSVLSSASGLPAWKQRKRKAPPPRVKSMDELILEESMRRNNRRTTGSTIPDLRVNGNNAPGYQCKWERFQHLPDIRPLPTREFNRQVTTINNSQFLYQDADANFSQNRVDEILKSEGFLSPDSGVGLGHSSEASSSPNTNMSRVIFDDEFLKSQNLPSSRGHNTRISGKRMFNIQNSRVEPQVRPALQKKSPVTPGESLAILQATKRRLPSLTTHAIGPGQPRNKQ